jgi:hypothetical protein
MTRKKRQGKQDFIKVFLKSVDDDTRDEQAAKEFLQSDGFNVDRTKQEGLNRIKQMQLLIDAEKTEAEMAAAGPFVKRATEWVDSVLNSTTFSLKKLVQEEELTMSFSNMEHQSKDELRNILIRHFTLKFMKG